MLDNNEWRNFENEFLRRTQVAGFNLPEPVETEYGWYPTTTFWFRKRRVHFYFEREWKSVTVEVAEMQSDHPVLTGQIYLVDDAWKIIDSFLHLQCAFNELPNYNWKVDELGGYDKFIPHPPNQSNPANIIQLIKHPNATIWTPPQASFMDKAVGILRNFLSKFR